MTKRHCYFPVLLCSLLLGSLLTGCAVNPVTGKHELSLSSESWELNVGAQQYQPALQSQGGEYLLDAQLSAYISEVGQRVAAKSDRPELPWEFTVLNNSVANAWALPGGKIAINRGLLLALHSEAELAAVLGHEVVHAAARHGAQKMDQGMLMGAGVQLLSVGLGDNEYRDLIIGGSALGLQLIQSKYGREQELEADNYGMDYMSRAGYDPSGAVELQRTFVKMSEDQQSVFWQQLFASHPPSPDRLSANQKKSRTLPSGETGQARYQEKTLHLRKTAQAYAAHDQGRQQLTKGDATSALTLANQAIAQYDKESLFYELKGLCLQKQGDQLKALAAFDQAVDRNDQYYGHYLARGLLLQQMGHADLANKDLQASLQLLSTATANEALGRLAMDRDDTRQAYQHFSLAAQSDGSAGSAARRALLRLDLKQSPHKYLLPSLTLDSQGRLQAHVQNLAPVPVQQIQLIITDGKEKQLLTYRATLAPNQTSDPITTRIQPGPQQLDQYRIAVQSAQLKD